MRDCKGSVGSGKLVIFMARRGNCCLFGAGNGMVENRLLKQWRLERKLQVFAGDGTSGNPLVYAQNSTTWSMSLMRKQVISRFLQLLITRLDFCELLVHSTQHFLSTKSTTSIVCAIYPQLFQKLMTASVFWRRMYHPSRTWSTPYHGLLINGPQGSAAAKTVDPVKLVEWGLERLQQNLHQFSSFDHTNLLGCMTLDVENLQSSVHHKNQVSGERETKTNLLVSVLLYKSWLLVPAS